MMFRLTQCSRGAVLAAVLATTFVAAPAVLAADITDIGFVDQGALATIPAFQAANRQVATYGEALQRQYAARAKNAPRDEQAKLAQEFQRKVAERQRTAFGPLLLRARVAIASVASSKNLSVVVDKRIVVYGGQDITNNVRDLLTSPGDPVPPASTPAPSSVGFVDQAVVDNFPKAKTAQETFAAFKTDEDKSAQDKFRAAKTDADRDAILKDYRKALDAETDRVIKPVVDQTRAAVNDVAKKRGLVLVLDRDMIIYGGTDITADVTAALK
jgi:outer membrane protein